MTDGVGLGVAGGVIAVVLLCGGLYGCPQYNVYQQRLAGEAELAKADYTRRTAVLEAQAKLDSASKLADAEIARARGVAEANKIIGISLKDNEAYLRWLWIEALQNGKNSVIYVPTEAGLPILEAGKRLP
jgi:regulator of protease activity HflC (stomatin/prohibitin superfamily)